MVTIMQLSMPSIWSIIYHEVTNDNTAPQGRGDVDTRSCVVLLLDLFTQWLNGGQLSHVIITEVIRCVSDHCIEYNMSSLAYRSSSYQICSLVLNNTIGCYYSLLPLMTSCLVKIQLDTVTSFMGC